MNASACIDRGFDTWVRVLDVPVSSTPVKAVVFRLRSAASGWLLGAFTFSSRGYLLKGGKFAASWPCRWDGVSEGKLVHFFGFRGDNFVKNGAIFFVSLVGRAHKSELDSCSYVSFLV